MKALAWSLAVLVAAVAATLVVRADNGYLLIGYGHWTVELSLALAALLLGAAFAALHLLLRLLARTRALPRTLRALQHRRAEQRARVALTRGLIDLAEGNWRAAEKNLTRHAAESETRLLNYLAAARAAQQQGADDRRDRYLQLAHQSTPAADVAVGLTQAELQIAHQQLEQALATLRHLHRMAPRHAYVLGMLQQLYERLGEWERLRDLLPELRRTKALGEEALAALERRVHLRLLDRAAADADRSRLAAAWSDAPKALRADAQILESYATHLLARGDATAAEALLRDALKHEWSERLAELYGQIECPEPAKQLGFLEGLLAEKPRSPALLLALGRLSLRARLWGKARSYLEASIGAGGRAEACNELGNLLEELGERDAALACYRQGLAAAVATPPVKIPPGAITGTGHGQRLLNASEQAAAQPFDAPSAAYSKASA
jgi:HemY protein